MVKEFVLGLLGIGGHGVISSEAELVSLLLRDADEEAAAAAAASRRARSRFSLSNLFL